MLKRQQMPTERELDTAIFWRFSLEDLRAVFGRDNEIVESISRLVGLTPPVPRVTSLEEKLLGG